MDKKDSEVSSTNIESSESSIENEAKEDTLSKSIGELGRWQIFLIVIVTIPCQMTSAWNMLSIIFLAPKTKYRCISRLNSTEDIFNGTCYSDCEEYEYTTDFPKNIITEFELICDRAWLANLTQTLFMFGVLVGSMVFGFIADRYGRRKAILISSMLQMTLSLLLPFSPEYWTFTTIRFLLGTSTAGSLIIAYVFVIEIVGPSKRELVGSVCHIPFLMGEMIMPVIAYYLRSWKSFALGLGIPNLMFLLHIFLLPESPRWLISVGRLEEASAVMKRAAKWNNLPTKNILEAAKNIAKESNANCNQVEHKSISYMDLISNSRLRMKNLLSCVSWFILSLSFYGVTQYIGQTSTSVFITMTLVGGWQIPSMLGSGYLSKRYGRRSAIIGFLLISSVCSGLLALPDSWFYTKIAVGAIGTGCAAGAFNIMYVFTSELFPTVARNMAMGASSTVSRLGSMLAPFVAGTSQGAWVPPLVFAAAPLVAAGVCWCLPETKGRKLTDRLVDE